MSLSESITITPPPSEQKLINMAHASMYSMANSTNIDVSNQISFCVRITKSIKCLTTQPWSTLKLEQQEHKLKYANKIWIMMILFGLEYVNIIEIFRERTFINLLSHPDLTHGDQNLRKSF